MYPLASSAPDGRTPASPRFPEIERRILAYWDEDGTFQASICLLYTSPSPRD